jgi:hypothetical protein
MQNIFQENIPLFFNVINLKWAIFKLLLENYSSSLIRHSLLGIKLPISEKWLKLILKSIILKVILYIRMNYKQLRKKIRK